MRALFFDLDGTLTDINQREVEVIRETLNHFDLKVSKTRVEQAIVETASYMDVFKTLGFELTEESRQYWNSAFIKAYRLSTLRRGVKSTLRGLSKDYTLVCVTSRETLAEVVEELRFLQLDGFFKHIVTRDVAAEHFRLASLPFFPFDQQRRKLYECALATTGCNPQDAVVVGDMGRELRPAKELGIATIGLVTLEGRKNELQKASDLLISSMSQLQKALEELNKSHLIHS